MTSAPGNDVMPTRAGSGVLGARPRPGQTFRGRDPQTVAASALSEVSPTGCQARTRLYRDGRLALEGFPVADISEHLADESVTVWLDLRDPDRDDLGVVSDEFGLHPLAVEDALHHSQRPKLDRYPSHLFLTAYATQLDAGTGELMTSELAAFVTRQALITVRKDDGLDIGAVVDRWDSSPELAGFGVGSLLYGLFDTVPRGMQVQRRSFQLRKSLVQLRRVVLPMRDVVDDLMQPSLHVVGKDLEPYYQDLYDHVLRVAEWTDSLRDLVNSILETNLVIQSNRLNIITKKVTGWAAIIAVPTLITGYFGMNVPYPGFGQTGGFAASVATIVLAGLILYLVFKRNDWL
jgi:magnesium transporter